MSEDWMHFASDEFASRLWSAVSEMGVATARGDGDCEDMKSMRSNTQRYVDSAFSYGCNAVFEERTQEYLPIKELLTIYGE